MRQDKPAKNVSEAVDALREPAAAEAGYSAAAPRLPAPPPLPGAGGGGSLATALAMIPDEAHTKPFDPGSDQATKTSGPVPAPTTQSDPKASGRRTAKRRPAGPARSNFAANDDIPTIGGLIYALEQKPSRRPFELAAYGSAAWLALGVAFTWVLFSAEAGRTSFLALLTTPAFLGIIAALVLPIAIFWFLALLVWRAQELKLMSSAMTEVAVRLAEPDKHAEQAVVSLGQTVRKQVSYMNDAVAQAITRAGELEAMVHSEVTTLERSFQDNEARIRAVLGSLAAERGNLVATSNDVHGTLKAMGDEVPALIEKLTAQQTKLAQIIEGAGQNLISLEGALMSASTKFEGSLGGLSDKVQSNLLTFEGTIGGISDKVQTNLLTFESAVGGMSDKVESSLMTSVERIEDALAERSALLQKVLDEYTVAINAALGQRTDQMQTVFEDYTRALDSTLVERTKALDGAFTERVRLFDDSLMRTTSAIDSVVGEKAIALSSAMDQHARQLADALGRQSDNIDDALMHGIDAVRRSSENITKQSVKAIEGLSGQADMLRNVSENLLTQIGSVTNRFEQQGQSIMRAANALETANFRIDSTLQQRHRDLGETLDKLTGKTTEIDGAMQAYSQHLEGSLSAAETRARSLTSDLARNAQAHAQSTIADIERMRKETEEHAARTLTDMHGQFTTLGREVSSQMGTLSSRLNDTSEGLRQQTQQAHAALSADQERLRLEAERIPAQTRESADMMRRALNDQLRALDHLSSMSSREVARRDVMPPPRAQMPASPTPPPQTGAARPGSLTSSWQQQRPPTPALPPAPQAPAAAPGWSLNELLSRADSDPAQPAGGGVDLPAMANAIDPDGAVSIWQRLKSGQRGVLSRNVFTVDGRATFDSVVRRYVTEPSFRGTVETFLNDFEMVLRDGDARDPTGETTLDHIASAGGRTYLFLAHASGRIS